MFSGVGCGIMLNGEIFTGSRGYAGEVSVYNFKEQDLFNCDFAKNCFIKRWERDLGIVDEMKERLAQEKQAANDFFQLTSSIIANVDLKSVFIGARAKNELAQSVLENAATRLGVKVAYLVNVLNPQIVVIGGGFEEAGEVFLNRLNSTVREWAFRESTEDLKIVYSQLRENAVAVGAASLVLQQVFSRLS
jgi:predicted NBD/HSP70 family sugar kinase